MRFIKFKLSQLLSSSLHLGHDISQSTNYSTWFIFGVRYNTLLISPAKMLFFWKKASLALISLASHFGSVLLINLDPSLNYLVKTCSNLIQQPVLLNKWRGGLLTNWKFVFLRKIPLLKKGFLAGTWSFDFMENLKMSTRLPTAIFTFNLAGSFLPILEAGSINLPVFSIVDSNTNSSGILYPIPGNDDAVSAITFYTFVISKSILLGRLAGISKYIKVRRSFY